MALQRTRSFPEARNRYQAALKLAESSADVHLRLKILNNLAWLEDDAGDYRRSAEVGERMVAFAAEHGVALDAGCLDTIAHAELMLGEYAAAERTLGPLLEDQHLEARETEGLAEALRTAAEAQRFQGNLDGAQATLDRCIRLCEDRGLGLNRVEAMEEQASLYAAHGQFEKAFRQHIAFHQADVALRAAEREANSRTLQAVFETNEARHEGQRFRELALRDPLTGLPNRRFVDSELPAILGTASDERSPLALGLLDIDHFKRVNDTYSHAVGDQVLMQIGKLLGEAAVASRPAGLAARMGGEEFLLVLSGELLDERFDALRKRIEGHAWDRIAQGLSVTVSIGVTRVRPGRATQSALLGRADRFLYIAKNEGRNRVVIDPD
jgi:diguanylate cyclase (GGDEF)-like protein